MSLRSRILTVVGVIVALILVAAVAVGAVFPDLLRTSSLVRGELQGATTTAVTMRLAQSDMNRGLEGWAYLNRPQDEQLYRAGRAAADAQVPNLERIAAQVPEVAGLVEDVITSHGRYITEVADVVEERRAAGDAAEALNVAVFSERSRTLYLDATQASTTLRDRLLAISSAQSTNLHDQLITLGAVLFIIAVSLLILVVVVNIALRDWVLDPWDRLRFQLATVTRGPRHEIPIEPSGPEEIAAVGRDAEHMRRRLTEEIDQARAAREALTQDAPGVAAIRAELLPDRPEPTVPGLVVRGMQQPAHGVLAGDWWDTWVLPDGRLAVVVTDVAGHGPAAGIAALRVKHTMTAALAAGTSLPECMGQISATFAQTPAMFATLVVLIVDPADGRLDWVNAGHVQPCIVHPSGERTLLTTTGPLLSALGGTWTSDSTSLSEGDHVIMATDGLLETHDAAGAILGDEAFYALASEHARGRNGMPPATDVIELVSRIVASVRERAIDWGRDDATIVGVARVRRS